MEYQGEDITGRIPHSIIGSNNIVFASGYKCPHCNFLNSYNDYICRMCVKSIVVNDILNQNKTIDMKEQILKISKDLQNDVITAENAKILLLDLFGAIIPSSELKPELESGYVKIEGCDEATGFVRICKESELEKVGKEIISEHPGDDGYYNFLKFLWVVYPDGSECRLDEVLPSFY